MPRQSAKSKVHDSSSNSGRESEADSHRRQQTSMSQQDQERFGLIAPMPLSGFKTPYVDSGMWADLGRIGESLGPDTERPKKPGEALAETGFYDIFNKNYDPYPAWSTDDVPITCEEIEGVFIQLTDIFGFQDDNNRNMFDYLLRLLDSRASRLGPSQALRSLHADYIGGVNSNFKKWYFAAQLDVHDSMDFDVTGTHKKPKKPKGEDALSVEEAGNQWCDNMNALAPLDCIIQLAMYLLCWGEANNIRFMPECLCFIFKCCNDYYYSLDLNASVESASPSFLDHVITPLYNFYRDQAYTPSEGEYHHNDKDHSSVIGYDDMNQLFWYAQGLNRMVLKDRKTKLMNYPPSERYSHLHEVMWSKAFYKTYMERRSWTHVIANFNRIWVIHVCGFWYYTTLNSPTLYTKNYSQSLNTQPTMQARLTIMALSGTVAIVFCLASTIFEFSFVPRKWTGAQPLVKRLSILLVALILSVAPTVFIFLTHSLDESSTVGLTLSIIQFIFSIAVVLYLAVVPLGNLFSRYLLTEESKFLPTKVFAASVHALKGYNKVASYGLWSAIFFSKFLESYFFLTLSLRDPVRELSTMKLSRCAGDVWIGTWLCANHAHIVLGLILLTDLVLFFLDTYLWYIVWNTVFSVCRSFNIGVSIWTPWRNIFSRLPKRIYSKIIANSSDRNIKAKLLVSQVWNSIIISMYREHLLSLDHVQKLIYKQIESTGGDGGYILKEPSFFISQEDQSMKSALFYEQSEAQRRITFFAQSLSTPMPEVGPISSMPSFTVLVPHYGEKITLSLREIIKEEEEYSHVTMLEYLKSLHPLEWSCFVKDTKLLAEEFDNDSSSMSYSKDKTDDSQYYSVGYKVATPEYILRTRIWASLRSQTLYRTISGFMNYSRAIKLLFDVENPDMTDFDDEYVKLEEASVMALRKFRLVASMQRLQHFSTEEKESTDFLLRAYPELQIAYLDEELDQESGETIYHSVLIDGSCAILEDGTRKPKYSIKLSGNPFLGDGKSDNQNQALIFARGEYIQLIDANQDNYLEECLKIRSVLAEFEETSLPSDPYSSEHRSSEYSNPVAIIGTREYIFSENIGILGDVAAGKEQTFGTLFARTLAHIGGKLHYGHPDFLNGVFMTTRGGVSKAQKGLHLNEDIYAGMNAVLRGGRIKHCEYMQCGKGRDLGFGSILNFTTKIGAGMGEQMLSREYFYLSSQLPLDRFLSFYYAHPGFHLNNVFIILSIKLFLLVAINLAALTSDSTICEYDRFRPITDPRRPSGCASLIPVVQWLERSVYSILIVFLISFVPLSVQELTERGAYKATTRLAKHFASLSPLFEVFVCKIYAHSLVSDISVGGARYIATGRGFATTRIPFSVLYSRFASESFYFGSLSGVLILYASITMWKYPLLYFWVTILGLLLCPFIYNPKQFSWSDFFIDYKNYLMWLNHGNSQSSISSWISFVRLGRSRLVGVKSKRIHSIAEMKLVTESKPSRLHVLIFDSILDLSVLGFVCCAYLFSNSQNESKGRLPANSLLRLLVVSLGPLLVNVIILIFFGVISMLIGPCITIIFKRFPAVIAAIVHSAAIANYIVFFEFMWFLQDWDFSRALLGYGLACLIQTWILKCVTVCLVTSEFRHDNANKSWWSGNWYTVGFKWLIFTQPFREFICKTTELTYFVGDVFIGHMILFVQFPILLIPYADKWHSIMLFWLKPGSEVRPRILSKKQKRRRRIVVNFYFFVYIISLLVLVSILILPLVATKVFEIDFEEFAPEIVQSLIQPYRAFNPRKGLRKGLIRNSY